VSYPSGKLHDLDDSLVVTASPFDNAFVDDAFVDEAAVLTLSATM
jgi:hypothetical protein